MKASFITWYPSCRRSDSIASALEGKSHLIHFGRFKQPLHAPVKYIRQAVVTWRRLNQDRPDTILVASPPVVAVFIVWLYAKLHRCQFVIDAHTGVFDDQRWTWLMPVTKFLSRSAVTTIVTNQHLVDEVESWGARSMVIADVPVDFSDSEIIELGDGFHVTVINTFSPDEPLDEVLEAARKSPDIQFHITGSLDHARRGINTDPPDNVRFTGWLSDAGYAGQLAASNALMCLTTHNHTMQRGAYEAMALHKPLVTSDWPLLRQIFGRGTVHVDNSVDAIVNAFATIREQEDKLTEEMAKLASERKTAFDTSLAKLRDAASDLNI